ncbi:secreted protein, partial [Candidatus Magnetomorum sp. HK-1]
MNIYKYFKCLIIFATILIFSPSAIASTPGNAVSFNGTTDYGFVNDSSELNLSNTGTWEFWVKREATTDETLISKTSDYLNNGFYISLSSGVVYFAQGVAGSVSTTIASAAIPQDEWCHVAVVKNNASCLIYVNGVDFTGTQGNHAAIVSNTAEMRFAKHNDNTQLLSGEMDEIRIWNIVRTPQQIVDNMHMRLGGNENGLVGYWQFDESAGIIIQDSSDNNNNCTLSDTLMRVESGAQIYNPEGPGGVGGINGLSKLCLWLKANAFTSVSDGQPVSIWTDISGFNQHFTPNSAPTFAQNAKNNQSAILFDGTDDYFAIANSQILNPVSMSVFSVVNPTGFAEENDIIALWGDYPSYVFGVYQSKGYVTFATAGGTNAVQNSTVLSGWSLLDATWDNTAYLFENGNLIGSDSTQPGALSQNLTGEIRVGGLQYTTEYYWDGHIAEVIMFSQPVTDPEHIILQNYLSAKYAIPLTPTVRDIYASSTYTQDLVGIGLESTFKKNTAYSAGLLLMDNGFLNDSGDYVIAAHNSPGNSVAYESLPVTIQMRWQRIWNIERTEQGSGSPNTLLLGFDFEGSGFEFLAGDPQDYSLLFRSGTTGNFSIKPTVSVTKRENTIIFEITSVQFSTGYYTIGCRLQPATNGPGGVGSTNGRSALSLWLKADTITHLSNGASLTEWADTSGNNHIFSSISTPIFQENIQNGYPAIYFDGTDDYLKIPNRNNLNPEEMTVFAVVDYDGSSTEHEIISLWNLNNDLLASYAIGVIDGQGYATFVSEGGMTSVQNSVNIGSNWTMINVSWSRLTGETYAENGGLIGENNLYTGPLKRNRSDEIRIGAVNYASPYVWKGHIAEIIMYSVPLNDAQNTIVQNYLSAKYAIALTPTSLDKYSSTDFDKDVVGIGRELDGKKAISSAAGLILMDKQNFLNDPGDYIMAGHSQAENAYTRTRLSGTIERRWSRTWYIDKTEANNPPSDNLTIAFDFSDSGINESAENPLDYTLLYCANTNDNFSAIQGVNVSKTGDQILFQVSNTDLQDGYYTIGTKTGAPIIGNITTQSTPAGSSLSIPLSITDVDNAPCSFNLTITSSNEILVPLQNISYTCSAGSYTISVTPASTQSGNSTITITVEDSEGLTSSSHFLVDFFPPGAGNTLDFDGTGYIDVPYNEDMNCNVFTFSAWVKVTGGQGTYRTVICSKYGNYGYTILLTTANIWRFAPYNGSSAAYNDSSESVVLGQWTHLAFVINGTQSIGYVNGIKIGEETGYASQGENPFRIGATLIDGTLASASLFVGEMDELRFYNQVLSQEEIQAEMCRKLTNYPTGLIAYYRFDNISGTTLTDLSGNQLDGTLFNMDNSNLLLSGAPLGDVSVYDYTGSVAGDFVVNLASSDGDQLTATGNGGTFSGIQLYLVNESPNVTSPPTGWDAINTDHYWGIFPVGNTPTYHLTYNYTGNSFVDNENAINLAYRQDNAASSWSALTTTLDTVSNTISKSNETSAEYILGNKSTPEFSTIQDQIEGSIHYINQTAELYFSITSNDAPCSLTITMISSDTSILPNENISVSCDNSNYTATLQPLTDMSGPVNITLVATNSNGLTSTNTISLVFSNNLPGAGRALTFDGIDDLIDLSEVPTTGSGSFTIEAWIKTDNQGRRKQIINYGDLTTNNGAWLLINPSDQLEMDWSNTAGPTSTMTITDNRWHHVVAVYESGNITLYIDGKSDGSAAIATPNIGTSMARIGYPLPSNGAEWIYKGQMDDIRIWNTARSIEQIQENMNKKLIDTESNLVAYYRFDHTSGDTLLDLSASGNHGTLTQTMDTDASWIVSTAPIGDFSHTGTGVSNLTATETVPITITWTDDPGADAIYSAIQVNDFPEKTTGLLSNYPATYWEIYLANPDPTVTANISFQYNDIGIVEDENNLQLYGRASAISDWVALTDITINIQGDSTDGLGIISLSNHNVRSGAKQFILSSDSTDNCFFSVSSIIDQTVGENESITSIAFTVSNPTGSLTISTLSSDTSIVPNENISVTGDGNEYSLSIIPASNEAGQVNIMLTISDGTYTITTSFDLTVEALPVISSIEDQETVSNLSISIAFQITDTEGGNLLLSATSSTLTLVTNENISFTGSNITTDGTSYTLTAASGVAEDITMTIVPSNGMTGNSTLTFQVDDNGVVVENSFNFDVLPLFLEDTNIILPDVRDSSVAFGDYDNDGDLDILLTGDTGGKIAKVYRNTGGSFSEDTGINLTGVYDSSVAFGDYDNDGDLDILLTGDTGSIKIAKVYRNTGG